MKQVGFTALVFQPNSQIDRDYKKFFLILAGTIRTMYRNVLVMTKNLFLANEIDFVMYTRTREWL